MRKRVRYFDMEKIECGSLPLTETEREVREHITHDPREALYARLDLEGILNVLTGKQKEVFELVVIDGHTEREAAAMLGISKGSVQVYVRRAKNKLREILLYA